MTKALRYWVGLLALVVAILPMVIAPALAVQLSPGRAATVMSPAHDATLVIAAVGVSPTMQPLSGSTKVYIAKTGTKYHRSNCRYVKRSKIRKTLSWVKAHHYAACKVCKPPTR
jgi:hypothetical protein